MQKVAAAIGQRGAHRAAGGDPHPSGARRCDVSVRLGDARRVGYGGRTIGKDVRGPGPQNI